METETRDITAPLCVRYGGEMRIVGKQQELKEGVLHQAEEWHVVPAPRMPAKHGFEIKHTHMTYTLQLQAAERRSPVLLRK